MRALALVFAAIAFAAPAPIAAAPSFDCAKAASAAEKRICASGALGDLDLALSEAFKAAQARDPGRSDAILADQQAWVRQRDRDCPDAGELCLAHSYRARLAKFATEAAGAQAVCRSLANRYSQRFGDLAPADNAKADPPDDALQRLAKSPQSGVTLASEIEKGPTDLKGLAAYARAARPPFTLSPALVKALADMSDASFTLMRLPGSVIYAADATQGTAHCHITSVFALRGGVAGPAADPPVWSEDGCLASRDFGAIDGVGAAFEDGSNYGPELTDVISVSPWRDERFAPFCSLIIHYKPNFGYAPLNPGDECKGADCPALAAAARRLAEAAQTDPQKLARDSAATLNDPQRARFAALQKDNPPLDAADDPALAKPEALLDQHPLQFPALIAGALYRVGVGHATIGWRTYSDWSVSFEEIAPQAIGEARTIIVGMSKGKLADIEVK